MCKINISELVKLRDARECNWPDDNLWNIFQLRASSILKNVSKITGVCIHWTGLLDFIFDVNRTPFSFLPTRELHPF